MSRLNTADFAVLVLGHKLKANMFSKTQATWRQSSSTTLTKVPTHRSVCLRSHNA